MILSFGIRALILRSEQNGETNAHLMNSELLNQKRMDGFQATLGDITKKLVVLVEIIKNQAGRLID